MRRNAAGAMSRCLPRPGGNGWWPAIIRSIRRLGPAIDDLTITHLLSHASGDCPATAYRSVHDDLPEPLCAIYRPTARPIIDRFVADGFKCPRKILINSPTQLLTQPNPGALHNINSPEDLAGTGIEQTL